MNTWKYASCEVQGLGHIDNDVPCQDKTLCFEHNGIHIISLSDGAGSARLSHLGAQCVVETISELISENFDELYYCTDGLRVKKHIVTEINHAIDQRAHEMMCDSDELAATLLFVAVSEDRFILGHIGDGVIGYMSGLDPKVAFPPSNGEFANETVFVTSNNAINAFNLARGELGDIIGFVVMSDGTENSFYHKPSGTLSKTIRKLISKAYLIEGEKMESQLITTFENVIRQKTRDDCSIAILSRDGIGTDYIANLDVVKQRDYFKINRNYSLSRIKKAIERNLLIMNSVANKPKDLKTIVHENKLKLKTTRREVNKLQENGLIIKREGKYSLN